MRPLSSSTAQENPNRPDELERMREEGRRRAKLLLATSGRIPAVLFTGRVRSGDRSVRSDAPLARPAPPVSGPDGNSRGQRRERGTRLIKIGRRFRKRRMPGARLVKFLRRSARGGICSGRQDWDVRGPARPFVAPFVVAASSTSEDCVCGGRATTVDLTPRYAAYFEVSILPRDDESDRPRQLSPLAESDGPFTTSDCVAIGLSTRPFDCHINMPGWDQHSYGYHGDDGGIFHASGLMEREYGPAYGPGDTVGCGVDYLNGGIFFTLNGEFLGYAWTGLDIIKKVSLRGGGSADKAEELYPTVGVDSACPVACNFGEREFSFDLGAFVREGSHGDAVRRALGGLVRDGRGDNSLPAAKASTDGRLGALPSGAF